MRKISIAILAILLALATQASAGVIVAPLDKMVADGAADEKIGVIIAMADRVDNMAMNSDLKTRKVTLAERHYEVITTLQAKATATQTSVLALLSSLESEGKVSDIRNFWIANMIAFKGTPEAINSIAVRADIEKIYFDFPITNIEPIRGEGTPPMITSHPDGLDAIHASQVWAMGYTGAGRIVSNIDTGVDGTHPALSARWRGNNGHPASECWKDPVQNSPTPADDGQHGTHTMGTICGRSTTTYDTVGVAIDAQWIAAGAIDDGSTTSQIIECFQWIADPDGNPGTTSDVPDAVGNSWGWSPFWPGYIHCDPTFWSAIDGCENAGVAVIFSAGNEGDYGANSLRTPADRATTYYNSFSVGAIDGHTAGYPIAYFSSLGPCDCATGNMAIKPECVAPGWNVYSSIPGGGYAGDWSGTSMASPHITGSVAILRQVNPNLDVDAIKDILIRSSEDLGPAGEDNTYGHGILNLFTAVQLAMYGFGYVDGYVRDAGTSAPLPAAVSVIGASNHTTANSSGYYIMGLAAETTYTLTASYFGYTSLNHNVTLIADDTVSQNFLLSPAPTAVLQGTVRNSGDTAIAGATVTILNTPLAPVTTNSSGLYSFPAVPVGYNAHVSVIAIGYGGGLDSVTIQSGTNVLNFELEHSESFEFNNGGYTGSGEWEWGVPTAGPTGAHSGTKCWGTILDGEYSNNADDILISSSFIVPSNSAIFQFYHWYATEDNYDGGNLSISTNGGSTWTLLYPEGGYPDSDLPGLDNEPGYDNTSGGWQLARFSMAGHAGQTVVFRWRFGSDGSITNYGWYIDDVSMLVPEPPNIAVTPTAIGDTLPIGGSSTHYLTVSNSGLGPLNFTASAGISSILTLDSGVEIPALVTPIIDKTFTVYDRPSDVVKNSNSEPVNPPQILDQGGPDTFGYRWIDSDEAGGPTYSWVDITGIGTQITGLDDDTNLGPYSIGFNFPFYGATFNTFRFCTNGFISFTSTDNEWTNTSLPLSTSPLDLIAGMWDDLYFPGGGAAYYYTDNSDSLVISYVNVPHWNSGGPYTFQIILQANGIITYQYQTINSPDNSATVGIQNSTGADGLQVVFDATYLHNNLAVRFYSSWLNVSPTAGIVNPGAQTQLQVSLDATSLSAGVHNGNIVIGSNDPDTPVINVPVTLRVQGAGPADISITPSAIADTLVQGTQSVFSLRIRNVGGSNLIANLSAIESSFILSTKNHEDEPVQNSKVSAAISLKDDSGDEELLNVWLFISPSADTIAVGDSLIAQVTLNATTVGIGSHSGQVRITSNDPDEATVNIPITLLVTAPGAPEINLSRTAFNDTAAAGNSIIRYLYISNSGNALLYYGLHDNRAWITASPDTGNVPASQSDTIAVTISAASLTPGTYTGQVNVNSNDSNEGVTILPVTFIVTEPGGSGCDYVIGDINGNGTPNGIDVTFGVTFLKGGTAPPDTCFDCPSTGEFLLATGDVNGSCAFNGIDITFYVAFLKALQPALLYCPDCPPVSRTVVPAVIENGKKAETISN